MKEIVILGIGVAVGYYLLGGANKPMDGTYIKTGDKSKEIEGMQKAFEGIAGLKFDEYGNYDADTLAASKFLLAGTKALKPDGQINSVFVSDLSKIYYNSLKN